MRRLTLSDQKVIDAFLDKKSGESSKLLTDGTTLDIKGMGGSGLASWEAGKIVFQDLGSKSGEIVERAVRKKAPKNWIAASRKFAMDKSEAIDTLSSLFYRVTDYDPLVEKFERYMPGFLEEVDDALSDPLTAETFDTLDRFVIHVSDDDGFMDQNDDFMGSADAAIGALKSLI